MLLELKEQSLFYFEGFKTNGLPLFLFGFS